MLRLHLQGKIVLDKRDARDGCELIGAAGNSEIFAKYRHATPQEFHLRVT
jgi:hypothetical protein